jgi:hypothetical protein
MNNSEEKIVKEKEIKSPNPAIRNEPSEHLDSATTAEEDLHSLSQRDINKKWESTQASISLMIIGTTCFGLILAITLKTIFPHLVGGSLIPAEWWTIVGLVIGFYFGRTNHSRVGGVQLGR